MALVVIVGCALTPSQQIVAAGQGAGQAIGAKLLADHSVNGTVDPAYLASYESEIPKVAGLMQGAITPADLHAILGVSSSVKLSSSQLAVVGLLNGVSAEYIKVNGGSTPTPDGALTDAAAKQVAAGLASAVGLVTGTNYTPPSS
jgi:hypothetical protein